MITKLASPADLATVGLTVGLGLDAGAEAYKAGLMANKGNKADAAVRTAGGTLAGMGAGHLLGRAIAPKFGKYAPLVKPITTILGSAAGGSLGYESSRDARQKRG